jgi:predicted aspartyl protease
MSRQKTYLFLMSVFFIFVVWQLVLRSEDVSPKPEQPKSSYLIQQAGGGVFMLDPHQGKTWLLRKQENSKAVWLPIAKVDSEREAASLWPKTTIYNLEPQNKEQTKSLSSLLKERGYVRVSLDKLRVGYYAARTRINGNQVYLIVDSGQPITHLDLERTKPLKLKWTPVDNGGQKNPQAEGSTIDSVATIDKLEIGEIETGKMLVGGHDLSEVNKIVKAYLDPLVDGELGSDVLCKYGAIIDLSIPAMYLRSQKEK